MIPKPSTLRRVLLASAVVAGLALAPPAEARTPKGGGPVAVWTQHGNPLGSLWHWLHSLWGKEGSSMDPFGHH